MDYVTLSALQHYAFCPRQCALIHVEQVWDDNVHTAQGLEMHANAHSGQKRTMSSDVRWATDMELTSERLGLHGKTDVVEFRLCEGVWKPRPVEYKQGHPKKDCDADEIQLCGQAICLEEMTGLPIEEGDLFYGETRHRKSVVFTPELRHRTEETAKAVHRLLDEGVTPPAVRKPGCRACSLKDICLPSIENTAALAYVASLYEDAR